MSQDQANHTERHHAERAKPAVSSQEPDNPLMSGALRVTVTLLSLFPVQLIDVLAHLSSWLFVLVPSRARDQSFVNIRRVYGLPPHSEFARMFIRQWVRHAVCCSLETLKGIDHPSRLKVTGFGDLKTQTRTLEAAGKGVIFVTSHLGSWELCAYYAGRACEKRLHVLAKPPKRPWAKGELTRLRRKMHVEVIWTDHKNVLKAMLTALKVGDSLGFVMDQKPERRLGEEVTFLGLPTPFVGGPATLCAKASVPVIGIHVVRTGPFRYHIDSRVLIEPGAMADKSESELTQIFASYIESAIRKYPEQWTWNYKRWKASPEESSPTPAAVTP